MTVEIFAISGLVNFLVAVGLGFLVLIKNKQEGTNRLFLYMITSFALWSFAYWRWLISTDFPEALLWIRILSIGSLFIPVFFFHWVVRLSNQYKSHKLIIFFAYTITALMLSTSFSGLFVETVSQKLIFPFWPTPGILYTAYLILVYIGLVSYSLSLLLRAYKKSKLPEEKGRFFYVILGTIIGFGGGLTNFLLWYDIPVPPYGNFLVAGFPFFLGYSIVQYRLFNAKGIATEVLSFFVAIALLAQTVLSESYSEFFMRGLFFIVATIFGYLIVRSVYKEVDAREKIQKLAEDLEKANARLKELDQQKSEFVSIASHQLRSPLTAIKGYTSMLLEGSFGGIEPKAREAVGRVLESSQHLVNLVEDLLNISRIEQGRMDYKFEIVDLKKMSEDIIGSLLPNAQTKSLKLSYKDDGEGPYLVNADAEKLRQVVLNLIDNAIKYTQKGFVEVFLKEDTRNKKIILSVTDSGVGVPPELKSRLFEKFSRGDDKLKLHVNGTGLGLYVAKEMLKAHKGDIWVESPGEDKGSIFSISIPVAK